MKRVLLILSIILFTIPSIVSAQDAHREDKISFSSQSPDKTSKVFGKIKLRNPDQALFIHNGILEKERVLVKQSFRYEPKVTWHNDCFVEVTIGTGSPGRYSIFYDQKKDTISGSLWFVLATDSRKKIALLGEDRLRLVGIFNNNEIMEVKPDDLPSTAITALVVNAAKFDDKGNLHIQYQNTKGGKSSITIESDKIKN